MKNNSAAIAQKTNSALNILFQFDKKGEGNPDWNLIAGNIYKSLVNNKPITLVSFTCSTINSEYMFSSEPEKYVSLNPKGNNLENDLPVLKKMTAVLKSKKIPLKVIILIGNTDPFYIYTQEGKTTPYAKKEFFEKFNRRWKIYRRNLNQWLISKLPKDSFEVISWYDLEKEWEEKNKTNFLKLFTQTKNNINKYFSQREFAWELSRLNMAFGPGQYFGDLKKPSKNILKAWIRRKFAEYAIQGLWIKQIFPEATLLQNEKPSDLRTTMYQPLIKQILNTRLPAIYPYGVDNLGFR